MTLKHGSFSALDGFQLLKDNKLGQRIGSRRILVGFPPFHVAGISYGLAAPIWVDCTIVLPPAVPLSAELIHSMHLTANIDVTMLPSSLVTDLAENPEHLATLTTLDGVSFAGGPLPEAVGEKIAQPTVLSPGCGASEWNAVSQLTKPREDRAYCHFNQEEGGLKFRERGHHLHELGICRRPEHMFLSQCLSLSRILMISKPKTCLRSIPFDRRPGSTCPGLMI